MMSISSKACSRSGLPSSVDPASCPSIHPHAPCWSTTFSGANSVSRRDSGRFTRPFYALSRQTGLRAPGPRNGPRLHDFRHRFAVQVLTRWYESGEDPARRLPVLSTYLGHVYVAGTYWYLSNWPELMAQAVARLERRWGETS